MPCGNWSPEGRSAYVADSPLLTKKEAAAFWGKPMHRKTGTVKQRRGQPLPSRATPVDPKLLPAVERFADLLLADLLKNPEKWKGKRYA